MCESLSDQLLAHVFNYAWPDASVLSTVSKRFSAIVQRKEFWRPAIQRELARRLPLAPLSLREFVDPFYTFPPNCREPWPWHYWLGWMFSRRLSLVLLSGTDGWTFLCIDNHVRDDSLWFGQSRCGTLWRIIREYGWAHGPQYAESVTWYPEQRHMLKVDGATVWIDSSIPDAARDGEFAMWRGQVYNERGIDRPLLSAGRYKH